MSYSAGNGSLNCGALRKMNFFDTSSHVNHKTNNNLCKKVSSRFSKSINSLS